MDDRIESPRTQLVNRHRTITRRAKDGLRLDSIKELTEASGRCKRKDGRSPKPFVVGLPRLQRNKSCSPDSQKSSSLVRDSLQQDMAASVVGRVGDKHAQYSRRAVCPQCICSSLTLQRVLLHRIFRSYSGPHILPRYLEISLNRF